MDRNSVGYTAEKDFSSMMIGGVSFLCSGHRTPFNFLEGFTCFFSCLWDHNQRWRCYTADDDLKVEVKRSMDVCTRKGGADLQCPSFILDDRACNRDSAKIWKCPKDEQLQPKGCACNTNDVYLMLSIMYRYSLSYSTLDLILKKRGNTMWI